MDKHNRQGRRKKKGLSHINAELSTETGVIKNYKDSYHNNVYES